MSVKRKAEDKDDKDGVGESKVRSLDENDNKKIKLNDISLEKNTNFRGYFRVNLMVHESRRCSPCRCCSLQVNFCLLLRLSFKKE